jgi:hypothetical protein
VLGLAALAHEVLAQMPVGGVKQSHAKRKEEDVTGAAQLVPNTPW